jgi:hypothetical protein
MIHLDDLTSSQVGHCYNGSNTRNQCFWGTFSKMPVITKLLKSGSPNFVGMLPTHIPSYITIIGVTGVTRVSYYTF